MGGRNASFVPLINGGWDVPGVERRSMRNGEAIVGGMMMVGQLSFTGSFFSQQGWTIRSVRTGI